MELDAMPLINASFTLRSCWFWA